MTRRGNRVAAAGSHLAAHASADEARGDPGAIVVRQLLVGDGERFVQLSSGDSQLAERLQVPWGSRPVVPRSNALGILER